MDFVVEQNIADLTLKQTYHNQTQADIETLFIIPHSEDFALYELDVMFKLGDDTVKRFTTEIVEKN